MDKLTEMCNAMYSSLQTTKLEAVECSDFSFLSHTSKLLISIILKNNFEQNRQRSAKSKQVLGKITAQEEECSTSE